MPDPLSSLPTEILNLILNGLGSPNWLLLRLVCRNLNEQSLDRVAKTCFTTLNSNLTPKSLLRLQQVSQLEFLRCCPQTLTIISELDERKRQTLGRRFSWTRLSQGRLAGLIRGDCLRSVTSECTS